MAVLLLRGLVTVVAIYPLIGEARRLERRRVWSLGLLRALDVALISEGPAPPEGAFIVANHVSWLDIFAINALAPAAFIAKSEVRAWPLIGWLAAHNDTIFVQRASRAQARTANRRIARLVGCSRRAALFAEGTTSDGSKVLPFHAALLQPAIDAGAPVVPLAIRYEGRDGSRSTIPAYIGATSLIESLAAVCNADGLQVRLLWCSPREVDRKHRKQLCSETRHEICRELARHEPDAIALVV